MSGNGDKKKWYVLEGGFHHLGCPSCFNAAFVPSNPFGELPETHRVVPDYNSEHPMPFNLVCRECNKKIAWWNKQCWENNTSLITTDYQVYFAAQAEEKKKP